MLDILRSAQDKFCLKGFLSGSWQKIQISMDSCHTGSFTQKLREEPFNSSVLTAISEAALARGNEAVIQISDLYDHVKV